MNAHYVTRTLYFRVLFDIDQKAFRAGETESKTTGVTPNSIYKKLLAGRNLALLCRNEARFVHGLPLYPYRLSHSIGRRGYVLALLDCSI